MNVLTKLCLGAALTLTLAAPGIAQDQPAAEAAPEPAPALTPDTVVASVNGVDITVGNMALARAALDDQYQQFPPDVLFNGLREQLIQQVLLEQSLKDVPVQLHFLIENERRRMIASEAVGQIADGAATEAAVQEAYDRDYASAPPVKEYNASHILLETQEAAEAALARAKAGEDFGDLARELSTGPSGPAGGQLGWFTPEQLVKPFSDAVVAMTKGEIAGPVQTEFGWHVILLNDVRDKPVPPLAEVRSDIEDTLRQAAAEKAVEAMVNAAQIVKVEGLDPAAVIDGSVFSKE